MHTTTKKIKSMIILLLVFSFVLAFSKGFTAKAEPKTIVVPDDYSTIQAAINSASEGDNIFVKSGTYYNQSLVVNKTVSLVGEDAKTTILRGLDVTWPVAQSNSMVDGLDYIPVSQSGMSSSLGSKVQLLALDKGNNPELSLCNFLPPITIVIQVEANDVTISGFTITNAYTGITGGENGTKIIGNIIRVGNNGMSIGGSYKTIAYNNITGGLHSILCSGSYNNITKNNIINPSNLGIDLTGSFNTILGNSITSGQYGGNYGRGIQVNGNSNTITENTLSGGSVGIALETGSGNTVFGNAVTEHWFMGIHLHDATHSIVYENYIADNVWEHDGYGVSLSGRDYHAENNTFYRNVFMNNSYNVRVEAPYYVNYWDNGEEGNYWDDYTGVDNDGDGIGDSSHILFENNQDNYPLMEPNAIPEFPSWIILPLFLMATFVGVIIKKRVPHSKQNRNALVFSNS
jgi:nitrous oxidase accessory protein